MTDIEAEYDDLDEFVFGDYPRLTAKLLDLSVADDYEEAKKEWRVTGKVWRQTIQRNGFQPRNEYIMNHPSGHPNHCLCGHPIVYHFEIENTQNNNLEIVGSSCVNNWMVLRHLSENKGIDINAITEKDIEEWKQQMVKSLICDAWWEEHGEEFEEDFNRIKDMDLRINVTHTGKKYYDDTLKLLRPITRIRKSSKGEKFSPEYQMASIVWRWNHPENPKAQINTTGFPNDRLMQDLALFYVNVLSDLKPKFDEYSQKRNNRIQYVKDRKERARIRREEERLRRLEEERKRQEYLQSDEYKEVLKQREIERQRQIELMEKRRKEEEQRRKEQLLLSLNANKAFLDEMSQEFIWACEYYSITPFNSSWVESRYTLNFLLTTKKSLLENKKLDSNTISVLSNLAKEFQPTKQQITKLSELGFKETVYSKKDANEIIERLTGEKDDYEEE